MCLLSVRHQGLDLLSRHPPPKLDFMLVLLLDHFFAELPQ
jgi:hypothetical protein